MGLRRLEIVRRSLIAASFACVIAGWVFEPTRGAAAALMLAFALTSLPAAMLSLHLLERKHRDRHRD
jgi:hypothetical protein